MEFKNFVSLNVAVIGDGNISDRYTAALVAAGHEVYLAGKGALNPLWAYADNVTPCTIAEAADVADFVIIATQPKDVREVAYWLGDVRRKVIIDLTANIASNDSEFFNTVGAIASITGAQHITKVFNTNGYQQMLKPLFGGAEVEMILAGDSRKAKEITKIIAKEMGISLFYDFGDNTTLQLFDEMTRCWRNIPPPDNAKVKKMKEA